MEQVQPHNYPYIILKDKKEQKLSLTWLLG